MTPENKKTRQEIYAENASRKLAAKQEEERKRKRSNARYTIIGTIVVVLIVLVLILNSNLPYRATALTVDGEKYSVTDVNYFYYGQYYEFRNQNASYINYLIDVNTPLNKQQYDDETTWADYFKDQAVDAIEQMQMLCAAAEADGVTLSDENKAAIDESIETLKGYAKTNGMSLKQYLIAAYGRGTTEKSIRSIMEKTYLAAQYSQTALDSFTYTPEQLTAYYSDHADEFDTILYAYYRCDGSIDTEDMSEEAAAAAKQAAVAEAQDLADEIILAAGSTEQTFTDAVDTLANDTIISTSSQGNNLSAVYGDWLLDRARTAGNTTVIDTDDGAYVVMFLGRDNNDYEMKSVRHILITVEANDDGIYTDEALAAAKQKAEDVLAEWKAGEATEDSFAELANQYSEDPGSNASGGLYTNVVKHQMVEPFENFCFNEDHTYGDTAIVYAESAQYHGFHVMYYVGDAGNYADSLAKNAMLSADYSAWEESKMGEPTVVRGGAMRRVGN